MASLSSSNVPSSLLPLYQPISDPFRVWSLGRDISKEELGREISTTLVDKYCGNDRTGAVWTLQLVKVDCSFRDFFVGSPETFPFPTLHPEVWHSSPPSSLLLLRPPPLQEVILSRLTPFPSGTSSGPLEGSTVCPGGLWECGCLPTPQPSRFACLKCMPGGSPGCLKLPETHIKLCRWFPQSPAL